MRVYFDNAASTPISPEVIEAMISVMKANYGNPSSIHAEGRQARAAIETARKTMAKHLGASIGEIFFTSGGTEANNMAIKGAVRDLGVTRILTSPTEHHCVLHSVEFLEKQGVAVVWLQVDAAGRVDYDQLENLLQDTTHRTLVSLMYANNEIGTLLDFERVSELCKAHGALFHSDTVQAIGHFPIDLSKTYVSFISGSAHKFHGPKGVGFLYMNADNIIQPYIHGGSQERNMRAGTENIQSIVGMAKALDMACTGMDERRETIESIRQYLKDQLLAHFDGIQFHGDQDRYLYTVLNVSFPPSPKADLILLNLDINGISASGGSACASGVDVGSHVLTAIGADPDRKAIRFSFSHYNTKNEVDFVVEQLGKSIV
ncbi:MAG: cysteine desulfurase [Saprospirales bacterium]|nr:cysteine desulfurase [Saprospirales bacterium]